MAFPHMGNKYLLFLPMIGFGIGWASIMGVPFILAVAAIPKERCGVYMGLINVMICIPQLLQTFTFGAIYRTVLHGDPGKAVTLAGALLAVSALAMLWIRPTPRQQQAGTQAPTSPEPAAVTS